jgi:hypothetical protein
LPLFSCSVFLLRTKRLNICPVSGVYLHPTKYTRQFLSLLMAFFSEYEIINAFPDLTAEFYP